MEISDSTALNNFCNAAKKAHGKELVDIIQQALNHPNVFVLGELLDIPNVRELENYDKPQLELLKIFAYGTLSDYKANPTLPKLTEAQTIKLKKLSIVTSSNERKAIPYSDLLQQLDLENVRKLEDLVIDCLYQGLIKGKLDQKHKHLEVDYAIGRDLRPGQLDEMKSILVDWLQKSDTLMKTLQEKTQLALALEKENKEHKDDLEHRIEVIKTNLKVAMDSEMGETAPLTHAAGHEFDLDEKSLNRGKKIGTRKGPGRKAKGMY